MTERFGQYYQEDDDYSASYKTGEAKARITKVEIGYTKSGDKLMATIFLDIAEQGPMRYWLVDDRTSEEASERTNKNMTRFFDCFRIRRGDFNTQGWSGKVGIVFIDKGEPNPETGKQYYEIKRLVVPEKQAGYGNNYQQPAPQVPQQKWADARNDEELDNIPF